MCFQTAAAAVATILISLPASADTKEKITKTVTPDGLVVTWRIDHPNVARPVSHYKQIRFAEGDTVTIVTGGCCQTGGWGNTWKRYVDPTGPESDQKYHGLIRIPGVTEKFPRTTGAGGAGRQGLVRLQSLFRGNGTETFSGLFVVGDLSKVPDKERYLRLGYEDSDYSDNGYNDRDNGTDDQCVGLPDAYLVITVRNKNAPKGESPANTKRSAPSRSRN
jgi:hypothetical protein